MTTNAQDTTPSMDEVSTPTVVPTVAPIEPVVIVTPDDSSPVENKINNFEMKFPINVESTWDASAENVTLPSDASSKLTESLKTAPNQKYDPKWVNALQLGVQTGLREDMMDKAVNKEDTFYTQGIEGNTGLLTGAEPRFKAVSNQSLQGETAVLRVLSHLGLGTMFQIPLWHTGIWITVRAPSESQLLELHRQQIAEKIDLGRNTYGLIFSNTTAYTVDRLVNFVIQNMHSTTLKDAGDLREIISSHDIPALIWGIATAIYPRGFQYSRACTVDPSKCNHVIQERLNLSKIQWTNKRSLTEGQIAHMGNRKIGSMTKDSVLNYQKELLDCQNREVTISEGTDEAIKLTFKIPTISQYVAAGHRWISDIVTMVNKTFGMDSNEDERNEYIVSQGQATSIRQYRHWISSILIDDNAIEGEEDIDAVLSQTSSDDNFRNGVMEKLKTYIATSSISQIGIPTYKCPACGKDHESPLPQMTSIIPIDTIQVFFILLGQKIERLKIR